MNCLAGNEAFTFLMCFPTTQILRENSIFLLLSLIGYRVRFHYFFIYSFLSHIKEATWESILEK